MSLQLAPLDELRERYVIKKKVSSEEHGTLYVVKDTQADRQRLLLEIETPDIDEAELRQRVHWLREAVEALSQLEHPNLARLYESFEERGKQYVVMEFVDGVTAEKMLEMSLRRLQQNQVLAWADQLSGLIDYFHDRPRPITLPSLHAEALLITLEEQVKVADMGLDAILWEGKPAVVMPDDPAVAGDYVRLGQLLVHLLSGDENARDLKQAPSSVTKECVEFVDKLLSQGEKLTYTRFNEVPNDIERVRHPPVAPPPVASAAPDVSLGPASDSNAFAIGQQKRILAGLGIFTLVCLFLLVVASYMTGGYSRHGATIFAVGGDNRIGALPLNGKRGGIAMTFNGVQMQSALYFPSSNALLVADAKRARLLLLDGSTLALRSSIPSDPRPTRLLQDANSGQIFCLHGQSRDIGILSGDPPQMQAIVVAPAMPDYVVASADGARLYVASSQASCIFVLSQPDGAVLRVIKTPDPPGAMFLSTDDNSLWVASPLAANVSVFPNGTDGLPVEQSSLTVSDLKGTGPVQMVLSPDKKQAVVLCRDSSSITLLSVPDGSVSNSIALSGTQPDCWTWSGGKCYVSSSNGGGVTMVDVGSATKQDLGTLPFPAVGAAVAAP
jgi:DNA-binding beta-propeller fold protein YncE